MKRGISFLLAGILSLSLCINTFADEIKDNQNKLNDKNKNITENKDKIKEIENTQKDTQSQINSLDSKMNSIAGDLDKIRNNIDATSGDIVKLNTDIQNKAVEVDKQQQLMEERIRAMYKSGSMGYINIIFGSKSFTDLVERVVLIEKIASSDKQLIEALENNKKQLETKKQELEKKKTNLLGLQSESKDKMSLLDKQSDAKKQYMNELQKNKKEYEKMVEKEEAESKELAAKIKALQAVKVVSNGKLYCVTGKAYTVTSPYGNRFHPILQVNKFHSGIDIGVNVGTKIYALKDGQVVYAGTMSGYGNVVMINHGDIISLYAHLSAISVSEGAKVKGGDPIAASGNSGLSTGPHLHFEIRKPNGETINPISYYVK